MAKFNLIHFLKTYCKRIVYISGTECTVTEVSSGLSYLVFTPSSLKGIYLSVNSSSCGATEKAYFY